MSFVNRIQELGQRGSFQTTATFNDASRRLPSTLPVVILYGYQPRYRTTVASDRDALAPGDSVQQAGQMSLCFVGSDTVHRGASWDSTGRTDQSNIDRS